MPWPPCSRRAANRSTSATKAASPPICAITRSPSKLILEAIVKAGYQPGKDMRLALDPASSEFYEDGKYVFARSDKGARSSEDMVRYYARLARALSNRIDRRRPG